MVVVARKESVRAPTVRITIYRWYNIASLIPEIFLHFSYGVLSKLSNV